MPKNMLNWKRTNISNFFKKEPDKDFSPFEDAIMQFLLIAAAASYIIIGLALVLH
jgi:hypothetical protein